MKKVLQQKWSNILLLSCIFYSLPFQSIAQCGPLPEILYYKFDGTGTSVPNYASTPPIGTATATIMGSLSQGGVGKEGTAIVGSGMTTSTDYVNTNWAPSLGTGAWTISFWSSNITPSTTLFYIFGDLNTTFRCFTNGVAGANNWILRGPGITNVLITGGATVAPHVNTFVYDPVAGNIKAYLDSTLVNTVAQGIVNLSGTGPFKVVGYNTTNVGLPIGGLLDEFRVYNRALTDAEIKLIASRVKTIANADVNNVLSIPGTNSGTEDQAMNTSRVYNNVNCERIGIIENNTSAMGSTVFNVTVDNAIGTHNSQPYLARWFSVSPTTPSSADVTLFLTQNDFDNYNTYATANAWPLLPIGPADATGIANIRITKNDNAGFGVNPLVITPSSVIWNSTNNYWELKFSTPGFSQFHIHAANPNNAALPVSYLSIAVEKQNQSDLIRWTTANETNNSHFNILRSSDGTHFEKIGTVKSLANKGNSAANISYSFVDDLPLSGYNYYRLEQVDMDGQSYLSKIVNILWGINGSVVSVYPNPLKNILNTDINADKISQVEIRISDMSGRIIRSMEANTTIGINTFSTDVSTLASGIYTIQVIENEKTIYNSKIRKD